MPNFEVPVVNLLGITHTPNLGVRVLGSALVEVLRHSMPGIRIRSLDYGRIARDWCEHTSGEVVNVKHINLRYSWRLYLPNNIFRLLAVVALIRLIPNHRLRQRLLKRNPLLREIMEANANLAIAGGDSFSDIYGLPRLMYVSLPQILVLWLGKSLILLPQTYGPYKSRLGRWIARYILRRASLIYSRDSRGVALINALCQPLHCEVKTVPDVGLLLEPKPFSEAIAQQIAGWRQRPIVGLNVSKLLYMGGYDRKNMFGLKAHYAEMIGQLIDFLVKELECFVLLVPHVVGDVTSPESEWVLNRELLQQFQKEHPNHLGFIDESLDHRQIKQLIGNCDLFIGSRMHACIAALSQSVPTVALAYSDKFAGVMEMADVPVCVVDLRKADFSTICEAIQKTFESRTKLKVVLAEKLLTVRAKIMATFGEREFRSIIAEPIAR